MSVKSPPAALRGLADVPLFAGIGLMGGAMLRDFAIVATAFGVSFSEIKRAGVSGVIALFMGIIVSFIVGAAVAFAFGYSDAVSMTTIGAGAATLHRWPGDGSGTGRQLRCHGAQHCGRADPKSILVMIGTPFAARSIGLDNPRSAMVFGGLMGTTSGVAGGLLAATDPKLVPYGAMTATFYTGLGCLMGPSVLFIATQGTDGITEPWLTRSTRSSTVPNWNPPAGMHPARGRHRPAVRRAAPRHHGLYDPRSTAAAELPARESGPAS